MLRNVNATNIHSAIELGCKAMGNVLNKDDDNIPFFNTSVWPTAYFGQSEYHNESHVPGRHLNALLMAEIVAGVAVDEEVIQNLSNAVYFSFSSHIPMPLNRLQENGKLVGAPLHFVDHNIREGLHALYALSRFRKDSRADGLMHSAIAFINAHYIPNMAWDEHVTNDSTIKLHVSPYIQGLARTIGPLVKYYCSSNYAPALELAICLAEKAKDYFPVSGEFNVEIMRANHAHSIACVLSSLALLADTISDHELMDRVRNFYDNGMYEMRNELGWAIEVAGKEVPARGECNTSGDILETAMILGKHYGAKYFDDAERILRGHILPAQIRDTSFIKNPDNPKNEDRFYNVAERHLGLFGFPAPYGHQPKLIQRIDFNTDIVGGTVASICEAYANSTLYKNGIHYVNLLFDMKTDAIQVTSPYNEKGLTVTPLKPGPIFVRIPSWVDHTQIQLPASMGLVKGDWIYIPNPSAGEAVTIVFPLSERTILLHSSVHVLRAKMKGDIVVAMDNEGTDLTFFPEYTE